MGPRFAAQLKAVGPSPFSRDVTDRYWGEHQQGLNDGIATALSDAPAGARVAILGAGRCQDVDLVCLVANARVERVDLFDLDENSLFEGIEHARERLRSMNLELDKVSGTPLEITGVMEAFFEWMDRRTQSMPAHRQKPRAFKGRHMERWLTPISRFWDQAAEVSRIPVEHQRQYDLVVSDCILSQIMHTVEQAILDQLEHFMEGKIDQNNSAFWKRVKVEVARGVGTAHFRNLESMVQPGGQLFVASDQATIHRYVVRRSTWEVYSRNPDISSRLTEIYQKGDLVVLERMDRDPRFMWKRGDLEEMIRAALPNFETIHRSQWVWNRQPYQLGNEEEDWQAEAVQGVLLRAPT